MPMITSYQQLAQFVPDPVLVDIEEEYDRLFACARQLLAVAIESRKPITTLCSERPDVPIIVPERTDPRMPCRLEHLCAHSRGIRESIVPRLERLISLWSVLLRDCGRMA
jgi:hypothetical protein